MWVQAAIAIFSTVMSFMQQSRQAELQEKAAEQQRQAAAESAQIGEMNAQAKEAETVEAGRRQGLKNQQEEAAAKAAAFASGFVADENQGGSIALSLASQKTENARQLAWEKSAGSSQAEILRRQGAIGQATGMASASGMSAASLGTRIGSGATLLKAGQGIYDMWNMPSTGSTTIGSSMPMWGGGQ